MRFFVCALIAAGISASAWGDVSFWSAARGAGPHRIFQFDANGVFTGVAIEQVAGAQSSSWGYRDGASDRESHIYFGWDGGVARHNADGSGGAQIIAGAAPAGVGTWRALAYDPTGDEGRGSIWTQSFGSSLAEATLSGNLLRSYPNSGTAAYGLAYDDSDGNLWIQGNGTIVKIDKSSGQIIPGSGWITDPGGGALSGFHDGSGRLASVIQSQSDLLVVYDTKGAIVGGPWDLEGQTGESGNIGVVVIITDPCASQICGDTNCDGLFNGGDVDPFFLALGDPAAWQAAHPNCDILCAADVNHDWVVNGADIDPFFAALGVGGCTPP